MSKKTVKVVVRSRYARKDKREMNGREILVRHVYEVGETLEVSSEEYEANRAALALPEEIEREQAAARAAEDQARKAKGMSARDERQALKRASQAGLKASIEAHALRSERTARQNAETVKQLLNPQTTHRE